VVIDAQSASTGTPAGTRETERVQTRGALVLRRFLRRKSAVAGLVTLVVLFLLAFAGPHLTKWSYDSIDYTALLQPPSASHWFGTTQIGEDVYAQTLRGLQKSLIIGLLAALLTTGMAALVGAWAGYFGGWVDRTLSWIIDLLLVIPSFFILAILSPLFRGKTWLILVVLLAAFGWMIAARVVRNLTLTLKEREFVKAARFIGVPSRKIILRHIIANMSSYLIIDATIAVGLTILGESGLSYLGFGVQKPDISLGTLIADGTRAALTFPWLFLFSGSFLIITVLAVSVVGDGLRDALDPRSTGASPQLFRNVGSDEESAEPPMAMAGTVSPTAVLTQSAKREAPPGSHATESSVQPVPEAEPVADSPPDPDAILRVRDLRVVFPTEGGTLTAVRGMTYSIAPGEVVGIVGESGCGKSVSALATLGLLPGHARVTGSVQFRGRELLGLGDKELSAIRGKGISMVFQDPLSALTPVYTVGDQIAEAILVHRDISADAADRRAVELLDVVGIPYAKERARAFPHEFSGGMRQRVMIAMAMANDPALIIADEPTTALDVTIQAQIVEVLRTAQRETGAAVLIITHDLGLIAGFADRVLVMYAGKVVETATVDELFSAPRMPYTLGLLGSLPRVDAVRQGPLTPVEGAPPSLVALPPGCPFEPRCPLRVHECVTKEPVLLTVRTAAGAGSNGHTAACHRSGDIEKQGLTALDVFPAPPAAAPTTNGHRSGDERTIRVEGLVRHFPLTKGAIFRRRVGTVRAVDGVTFDIAEGEVLGLVGESGCGKTTTIGEIMTLARPMGGTVELLGKDTATLDGRERKAIRRNVGVVFQDPMDSLDPRMPVGDILTEGMETHGVPHAERAERVRTLLRRVGLDPSHASRYPHEFSGGQRQRIGIARALALEPRLLVLDEPVSALDVSIRAGVVNLLMELRRELGLSYLFVAHDLSLVRHIADRVAVMYLGRIVEMGHGDLVFDRPAHPYTQALLSAIPIPDPVRERARRRIILTGDPPSPAETPSGCRFRTRCPLYAGLDAEKRRACEEEDPPLYPQAGDQAAACHYARPANVF
jgi:peptide/nickel transport system ATP-binding protein